MRPREPGQTRRSQPRCRSAPGFGERLPVDAGLTQARPRVIRAPWCRVSLCRARMTRWQRPRWFGCGWPRSSHKTEFCKRLKEKGKGRSLLVSTEPCTSASSNARSFTLPRMVLPSACPFGQAAGNEQTAREVFCRNRLFQPQGPVHRSKNADSLWRSRSRYCFPLFCSSQPSPT